MKISPINSFLKTTFKGIDDDKKMPKKPTTYGDFVDFAKKDANKINISAKKLKNNGDLIQKVSERLKQEAKVYLQVLNSLMKDKNPKTRFGTESIIAPGRTLGGAKLFCQIDFEGNVEKIFIESPDGRTKTVKIDVELDDRNRDIAQKVFIFEDDKLKEVQIGKDADFKELKYDGVFFYVDDKLKSIYDKYKFDGEYGKIGGVYEFSPQGKLDVYTHKVEFSSNYKTNAGDFFFWEDNFFTYESDDVQAVVLDNKPSEYIRYFSVPISDKNGVVSSIRVDLKKLD